MPIEFRRMMGVVSVTLFVLVVLLTTGNMLASPLDSVVTHPPLKFFIPFSLWLVASFFTKLALIDSSDFHGAKVFTGCAVASGGVMFVLNDMGGAPLSPTVGGIVAVAWLLSWFLIDLTDLLIPSSWWKK